MTTEHVKTHIAQYDKQKQDVCMWWLSNFMANVGLAKSHHDVQWKQSLIARSDRLLQDHGIDGMELLQEYLRRDLTD